MLAADSAEQRQELALQLANGALVHEQPTLLQLALDFDQLALSVLVAPANEGQDIQTIAAVGQTDGQDSAGVVGRTRMRAGRIDTAVALPGHKDGPIERLDVLLDIPGLAMQKRVSTMQAGLVVTRDNQPLRICKAAGRAMTWLLLHGVPPVMYSYEA